MGLSAEQERDFNIVRRGIRPAVKASALEALFRIRSEVERLRAERDAAVEALKADYDQNWRGSDSPPGYPAWIGELARC
jgi:hypothetical protein